MGFSENYDVIVIGAGHAGCEAAMACARMGLDTVLATINLDLIAQMSCNPAVGGIAKGHLVREVDALGGIMGEVTDAVGIQFRLLNTSRGPAVWSPRAQCDKKQYRVKMRQVLESEPRLKIKQAEVADLIIEQNTNNIPTLRGVLLRDGRQVGAGAVVITTGTFLNGLIHVGETTYPAGRSGEPPSVLLGEALKRLGLRTARLKTGTPPRLDGRSIDWSRFEIQYGDPDPVPFSFRTGKIVREQLPCYVAYTTAETHRILQESISRSPLYSGQITGIGPRYCPSIEDKIVKFPDKLRHQIFLEPEGVDTNEIYVNGMSTSMPIEVQTAVVHSIPGLERAEMIRPGYAIEYDSVDATELDRALHVKSVRGLFLAGQINGTSGYEEAACQGIMAGINAARYVQGKEPVVLDRTQGYTGILIDDLVAKGTNEPYRMFTSRAEFRLHLRIDNADLRLTPIGHELGLISDADYRAFLTKQEHIVEISRVVGSMLHPVCGSEGERPTLANYLKRPEIRITGLLPLFGDRLGFEPSRAELECVEIQVKYEGYLVQQERQIERLRRSEKVRIPAAFEYAGIPGLSREITEKLVRVRPSTLGQASRIPGVTPAAIVVLQALLATSARGAVLSGN
jgi:tRNA uridine 5-carboxymethylaminomethyl modification enzyme